MTLDLLQLPRYRKCFYVGILLRLTDYTLPFLGRLAKTSKVLKTYTTFIFILNFYSGVTIALFAWGRRTKFNPIQVLS